MKLTRKMSPLLMGLVAVLVGCSMMGAAISVIVSANATSTATVTVQNAVTLTKSDADTEGLAFWENDYTFLDTASTPVVGAIYDINITVRATAILPNVMLYFKVLKAGSLIESTEVVVKQYNGNYSTSQWTQLDLESYGDYLQGTFLMWDLGTTGAAMTADWSDVYTFSVQFTQTDTYVFQWYAESINSPVAGTPVKP